jgi:uncharacterized damage-inducible protein DinB
MNMLQRLLGHDQAATRELLELCQPLSDEQLDREFDAGWRTLRATFSHMIGNIETWTDLMLQRPVRQIVGASIPELISRLNSAYSKFADFALQAERDGRLDDSFTDVLDNPPTQKPIGGAIGHLITHNMHHRAELQHMLNRLPLPNVPEGDLLSWELAHG